MGQKNPDYSSTMLQIPIRFLVKVAKSERSDDLIIKNMMIKGSEDY